MRLKYRAAREWPELAWVAAWRAGDEVALVTHGLGVETHPNWFGEIVWDGDFGTAGFDATDVAFGSAGKADETGITFVSSSATVDRLQWLEGHDGMRLVSNSLAALLATADATVDALRTNWGTDFQSIIHGIDRYIDRLPTSMGDARLLYYRNLRFEGGRFRIIDKPSPQAQLDGYGAYRDYLSSTLVKLSNNGIDARRSCRTYRLLGTVSTGFDSPTVCALARSAGLSEAITIASSRGGTPDDGTEIGARLGLHVHSVARDAWRESPLCETKFLASDAKGEDVYFAGAEGLLGGRLLLTGFAAAGTWSVKPREEDDLRRTDQAGLSLTEYRLHAGFIHVPVPTIGARRRSQILRALASPDMTAWRSGRAYDKPFCRRVLNEAGVPSELYGQEKKAASVLLFDRRSFLTGDGLNDFLAFVDRTSAGSLLTRVRRASHSVRSLAVSSLASAAIGSARTLKRVTQASIVQRAAGSLRLTEAAARDPRFDYLFPWAVEHICSLYRVLDAPQRTTSLDPTELETV